MGRLFSFCCGISIGFYFSYTMNKETYWNVKKNVAEPVRLEWNKKDANIYDVLQKLSTGTFESFSEYWNKKN